MKKYCIFEHGENIAEFEYKRDRENTFDMFKKINPRRNINKAVISV